MISKCCQLSGTFIYTGEKEEKLISSEKILSYFKDDNKRELYKKFVERQIRVKTEDEQNVG